MSQVFPEEKYPLETDEQDSGYGYHWKCPGCKRCARVSHREQVRQLLADGKTRTCMEILHTLGDFTSSDSLSSTLLKMVKNGELEAVPKFGPRGGRGYKKKV